MFIGADVPVNVAVIDKLLKERPAAGARMATPVGRIQKDPAR